jgi:hypothetical protein
MAYNYDPTQDPIVQEFERHLASQRAARQQRMALPAFEPPAPQPATSRTFGEVAGDTALSAARMAVGIPKAFTDLGTLVGIDAPSEMLGGWQESLAKQMSPIAQQNMAELQGALSRNDIGGTLAAGIAPSNLVDLSGQLVASLVGMKGLDKALMANKAYAALGAAHPFVRAGVAEGGITAGNVAAGIAEQNPEWGPERLLALPAGAITGAIGGAASRFLPNDIDVMTLLGRQGAADLAATVGRPASGNLVQRMVRGALQEGLVEEAPQSFQEAIWQNIATGDPALQGAGAQAALGGLMGGLMGGAVNMPTPPPRSRQPIDFQQWNGDWASAIPSTPAVPVSLLAAMGGLSGQGGANYQFPAPPAPPIQNQMFDLMNGGVQGAYTPVSFPPVAPTALPIGWTRSAADVPFGDTQPTPAERNQDRINATQSIISTLTALDTQLPMLQAQVVSAQQQMNAANAISGSRGKAQAAAVLQQAQDQLNNALTARQRLQAQLEGGVTPAAAPAAAAPAAAAPAAAAPAAAAPAAAAPAAAAPAAKTRAKAPSVKEVPAEAAYFTITGQSRDIDGRQMPRDVIIFDAQNTQIARFPFAASDDAVSFVSKLKKAKGIPHQVDYAQRAAQPPAAVTPPPMGENPQPPVPAAQAPTTPEQAPPTPAPGPEAAAPPTPTPISETTRAYLDQDVGLSERAKEVEADARAGATLIYQGERRAFTPDEVAAAKQQIAQQMQGQRRPRGGVKANDFKAALFGAKPAETAPAEVAATPATPAPAAAPATPAPATPATPATPAATAPPPLRFTPDGLNTYNRIKQSVEGDPKAQEAFDAALRAARAAGKKDKPLTGDKVTRIYNKMNVEATTPAAETVTTVTGPNISPDAQKLMDQVAKTRTPEYIAELEAALAQLAAQQNGAAITKEQLSQVLQALKKSPAEVVPESQNQQPTEPVATKSVAKSVKTAPADIATREVIADPDNPPRPSEAALARLIADPRVDIAAMPAEEQATARALNAPIEEGGPPLFTVIERVSYDIDTLNRLLKPTVFTFIKDGEFHTKPTTESVQTDPATLRQISNSLEQKYKALTAAFQLLSQRIVKNDGASKPSVSQLIAKAFAPGNESSPAIRFHQHWGAYQSGILQLGVIYNNPIRLYMTEQRKLQSDLRADTTRPEWQGVLTPATQLGRIALGEASALTQPGPDGELKNTAYGTLVAHQRTAARNAMAADGLTNPTEEQVKQAAAFSMLLHNISNKDISAMAQQVAMLIRKIMTPGGDIYRVNVRYHPISEAKHGNQVATYSPETHTITFYGARPFAPKMDGATTRNILHEGLHAAGAAYINNNPKAPEVQLLGAIGAALSSVIEQAKSKDNIYTINGQDYYLPEGFVTAIKSEERLAANEMYSYGLTHPDVHRLMKNTNANKALQEKAFGIEAGLKKLVELGKNMFRTFSNAVRAMFGLTETIGTAEDIRTQFDAFLIATEALNQSIQTARETFGDTGVQHPFKLAEKTGSTTRVLDTTDGAVLEDQYQQAQQYQRWKAAQEARLEEQRANAREATAAEQQAEQSATRPQTPQQRRALEQTTSKVLDALQTTERDRYRENPYFIDAPMRMLTEWFPNTIKARFGENGSMLDVRKAFAEFVSEHPTLGRVMTGIVSDYGLHPEVVINKFNKTSKLAAIDAAVSRLRGSSLAGQKEANAQLDAYLKDRTAVPSDRRIKEVGDLLIEALAEAKALGDQIIPAELHNAEPWELVQWLKGDKVPMVSGFRFGAVGGLMSPHNGFYEEVLGNTVSVTELNGQRLRMWIKHDPAAPEERQYQTVFTPYDIPTTDMARRLEANGRTGFAPTPYIYHGIERPGLPPQAFRFKTVAERDAENKAFRLIHSVGSTVQQIQHRVAGVRFNDEMIAENAVKDFRDKYLIENTPENIKKLTTDLGVSPDRIVSVADKPHMKNQKAFYTPGNWVVLKGAKWGKLDDYIVPATVYMAINDYNNRTLFGPKALRDINTFWKKNLTVRSLTAWVNNVTNSFVWSYYHDIPPRNIARGLKLLMEANYNKNPSQQALDFMKEIERSGALFGTMSISEEINVIGEKQLQAMMEAGEGKDGHMQVARAFWEPAITALKKAGTNLKAFDQLLSDIYAHQDNVFRAAAYITYVENVANKNGGKVTVADLEAAGKWAADSMINYDINARYIQAMRQTAWPFIAWPYRAVPMLAKLAVEKPWKLLNTIGAVWMVNALGYALMGSGAGDEDRERRVLPDYMKENVWGLPFAPGYVRLPFGPPGSGTFFGINRIIPLGDLLMVNDGAPVPQTAMPGGPVALGLWALGNYDSFRQQAIRDPSRPWGENMKSTLQYLLRGGLAPATPMRAVPGTETAPSWWDKVVRDKRGPLGAEANAYVETARLLGFNFREVDFAEAQYSQTQADTAKIRGIKASANRAIRNELRYGVPDLDAMMQHRTDMMDMMMDVWAERGFYALD